MRTHIKMGNEHPFLKHHHVLGNKVLPGLAYIDMCYQWFREQGFDYRSMELRHLRLYRPLKVQEHEEVTLTFECYRTEAGHWQIQLADQVQQETPLPSSSLYMSAEMHGVELWNTEDDTIDDLGTNSISDGERVTMNEIYGRCKQQGLIHSGWMQAEGSIQRGSASIKMELSLQTDFLQHASSFMFHPVLLDASAVAGGAMFTLFGEQNELFLPIYIESFRAGELIQRTCWTTLRSSTVKVSDELLSLCLEFYNGSGQRIAALTNFKSKHVRMEESPADSIYQAKREYQIYIIQKIAQRLNRPEAEINLHMGYYQMGLNSASLLGLTQEIEQIIGKNISPTLLFEYTTIDHLTDYLASAFPRIGLVQEVELTKIPLILSDHLPQPNEDIAVIGMAGRYPGASNLDEFWTNLLEGKDSIQEIPASRWAWKEFSDMRSPSGKSMSRWGGFVADYDCFDPQFFHITPSEAERLDPQERLFLQTCWETIEDAGYTPSTLTTPNKRQRNAVGVFVGVMHKDYALIGLEASKEEPVSLSLNYAPIANRVSYFCNFHGPSIAVDTVCSSSLTAVHLAIESIQRGECSVALAGGVNLSLHPAKYITYGMMDMHSSDGRCRTFGNEGDGYVSSEGVGAVLLKPLSRAIEDQDQIYAILKGSVINHGGQASGITVPSPSAQADLIQQGLEKVGIHARTITYVEAHGTGTILGDPIEMQGLTQAFQNYTNDLQFCAIGSVKSNIGHAESAAGIAALHKVILQLHHKTLVPSLHSAQSNPHIDFSNSPFVVQQEARPWNQPVGFVQGHNIQFPRRASISSFGATGSNAQVIVEEFHPTQSTTFEINNQDNSSGKKQWIPISARTQEQLQVYARRLADFVTRSRTETFDLEALAYTLQIGRVAQEERAIFQVQDTDELLQYLELLAEGSSNIEGLFRGKIDRMNTLLTSPNEGQRTMEEWIKERNFELAAKSWIHGELLSWQDLYPSGLPYRMHLPTYPFTRERYWYPEQILDPYSKAVPLQSGPYIHPLLHSNISNFRAQQFHSQFTGEEFFLKDHLVLGKRMLSGAAHLEIIRAAMEQSQSTDNRVSQDFTVLRMQHIVWVSPITVSSNSLDVTVGLFPRESDIHNIAFEICEGHQSEKSTAALTREARVYSQGSVSWVASPREAHIALNLRDVQEECSQQVWESEEVYAVFQKMGINHGPTHQAINKVYVGTNQVLAKLQLMNSLIEDKSSYMLHPVLIDAAFQACVVLFVSQVENSQSAVVPYTLEELTLHHACTSEMWVWIRYSTDRGNDAIIPKLDLDLCDSTGKVCVELRGFSVREMESAVITPLKEPFNEADKYWGTVLMHPVWKEQREEHRHSLTEPDSAQVKKIIVLCDLPHLAPLQGEKDVDDTIYLLFNSAEAPSMHYLDDGAVQLFSHIQRLISTTHIGQIQVQIVTPRVGQGRLYGALLGMIRSLELESRRGSGQVIEIDVKASRAFLNEKLSDYARGNKEYYVRMVGQQRQVQVWEPIDPISKGHIIMPWKNKGVYLITGGGGGLGLIFACEIAHTVEEPIIILAGRSSINSTIQSSLQELQQVGAQVGYMQMDVANRSDVETGLKEIVQQYGRLDGIIHCAGVVNDQLILHKTSSQFETVLAPKVNGIIHLDEASSAMSLDFIIAFSSAASVFGNIGQADYATANAFMDLYAEYRNELEKKGLRSGRMLSINWPLWEDAGMHMESQAKQDMMRRGLLPLQTDSGIQSLYEAWTTRHHQVLVLAGDIPTIHQRMCYASTIENTLTASNQELSATVEEVHDRVVQYLKEVLSSIIKLPKERIEVVAYIEDFGMDSIVILQVTNEMEKKLGSLSKTLFYEYRNLNELAHYLLRQYPDAWLTDDSSERNKRELSKLKNMEENPQRISSMATHLPSNVRLSSLSKLNRAPLPLVQKSSSIAPPTQATDIAVIGLSGRYPGARNLEEFWHNLKHGVDCITEIPHERWDYSQQPADLHSRNSRWGGFIEGVDEFDPGFFNISPREAETMDPQERIFLERVYEAMEDAGYVRNVYRENGTEHTGNIGVYVGVMYEEYQLYGAQEQQQGRPVALSGNAASIANRVSYYCNFTGPSMTIATMCSSSLTAIHLACQSLISNECNLAIAGGVNLSIHPNKYLLLGQGQFVSTKGRCESFGKGGDGYVPAEGVGAVLLKPLAKAIEDHDPIYGVIKGTAINHGGKVSGYTVPNPNAQAEVIRRSLQQSGVDAREISYIEAHGTGTSLGDPIEMAGLVKSFEGSTQDRQFCAIGSVKSNIGHAESAAGIAGLTKVLLQLKYSQLVPTLHAKELNPNIDFAQTPFVVQQELTSWSRPMINKNGESKEYPRTAGLSSFGAGGSNAHVVIQEYIPVYSEQKNMKDFESESVLIVLSARNEERLKEQVERLLHDIQHRPIEEHDLGNLAYTLQIGREAMEERFACTATSISEIQRKLKSYMAGASIPKEWHQDGVKRNKEMVSSLMKDDDMLRTLDMWMVKEKYEQVLELWVKGFPIPWLNLYPDPDKYHRMHLPTYPFAREKYWVPHSTLNRYWNNKVDWAVSQKQGLHPLVHANTTDLLEQRYTSTFYGNEFFLTDHKVLGRSIMPVAAYLEMVRSAVDEATLSLRKEQCCLRFKHIYCLHPLSMSTTPVKVHIGLYPSGQTQLDFDIYSYLEDRQEKMSYCKGAVEWNVRDEEETLLDLIRLQRECNQGVVESDQIYETFRQLGIEYGKGFQGLQRLHIGLNEIIAEIVLPMQIKDTFDAFVLHPSLLDAAFQATLGFHLNQSELQEKGIFLPYAIDEVNVLASCSSTMWGLVRYHGEQYSENSMEKFDIDLCNEQGQICIRMKGFSIRNYNEPLGLVGTEANQKMKFKSDMRTLTYKTVWEPMGLKTGMNCSNIAISTARVIIFGEAGQWRDSFLDSYTDAVWIDIQSHESVDTLYSKLLKLGQFSHIIWLAPSEEIHTATDEQWIKEQQSGVFHVHRLVQAVLQLELEGTSLAWTFITFQAQSIHRSDRIRTAHSSVHGYVGSMAKEFAAYWHVSLIDLELGALPSAKDLMSIPNDLKGITVAYRSGEWFYPQLIEIQGQLPESTKYKNHGVYVVIGGAGGIGEAWTEYMISNYQAQVIWIGRRNPDAAIIESLERLAQLGPAPYYISADASDLESLQQAYRQIKQQFPIIHGVIHSAIVMEDHTIALLDEQSLGAVLSAKVDVSVRISQVFSQEKLDFILFFSSFNAVARPIGQSNYSAGCTFKEAYAAYLNQTGDYPVQVIQWGYWGHVGIVASEVYRDRMALLGMGSIESSEAMLTLEFLLHSPLTTLTLLKIDRPIASELISYPEVLTIYSSSNLCYTEKSRGGLKLPAKLYQADSAIISKLTLYDGAKEMTNLIQSILAVSLREMGVFNSNILPKYSQWVEASQLFVHPIQHFENYGLDDLWTQWDASKTGWLQDANLRPQVVLTEMMLRSLTEVLCGSKAATDIMFPNSSLALVEGIYKNNLVAESFNEILADVLIHHVKERLQHGGNPYLRILEIGAGTGGTSERIFNKLEPYQDYIQVYNYTDISRAFLMHAKQQYGQYPYITYGIFNVEEDAAAQEIQLGSYDIVVATNVLHATKNIRRTVRNIKNLMHKDGLLLVNEITGNDLFTHVTFGLLEGWWAYEDAALRAPGGPGIAPKRWQSILSEEGFNSILFPALDVHPMGQQIICAKSDGIGRQVRSHPFLEGEADVLKQQRASDDVADSNFYEEDDLMDTFSMEHDNYLRQKSQQYFRHLIGQVLKLPQHKLDTTEPLETYGLDSIIVVQLTESLRPKLKGVTSTLFFEHKTIDSLVNHFIEHEPDALRTLVGAELSSTRNSNSIAESRNPKLESSASEYQLKSTFRYENSQKQQTISQVQDIAIIGISGRFPLAEGVHELWDNVKKARNCITEIPLDRWNGLDYYHPLKGKEGLTYSKWGGFVQDIYAFDPLFFHISPKEAAQMDPQERLFLEVAYASIEDAGYTPAALNPNKKVGVFTGVMNANYPTGAKYWSIANRVSYTLDFHGPSMAVDTACSSSLTALHLALESMYSGMSECALVGGVNLIVDPEHYVRLSSANMLSSGDTCKAFGAEADGFVDGESVSAMILKPLSKAVADGDHIYGVIKGSALNAGGKTNGYTVPNPAAQRQVIADAMQRAGVHPRTISYIEAHGTGTALGDPIEIAGLTQAFAYHTQDKQFCAIGSIKSNVGHSESASGMTGLVKVLMQMKHQQIAPTLHASVVNPEISFEQTPFILQHTLEEWRRPLLNMDGTEQEYPRRAGISSFGAGGANAHIVVEEYIDQEVNIHDASNANQPVLIVLSAKNEDRLKAMTHRLLEDIVQNNYTDDILRNMAYTLQLGREDMEERLAVPARTINDLIATLKSFLSDEDIPLEYYRGNTKVNSEITKVLSSDPEMHRTIGAWIQQQKWPRLLELWVKGLEIPWKLLYEKQAIPPRRMSLPSYPFSKERYLIKGTFNKVKQNIENVTPEERSDIMTFEEIWIETELQTYLDINGTDKEKVWVILLDNEQDKDKFWNELKKLNSHITFEFIHESANSAMLSAAFDQVNALHQEVDAVIDFRWLTPSSPDHRTTGLVHLLQSLTRTRLKVNKLLVAGAFITELERCSMESWIGFERSIGNVIPNIQMIVVIGETLLERNDVAVSHWVERIYREVNSTSKGSVLYREGKRCVCHIKSTTVLDRVVEPKWVEGATYLITGGLGGLGYLCAEHIATLKRVKLILTGRSVVEIEMHKKLDALVALGSDVTYIQTDVCDVVQMREQIDGLDPRFGPIRGVIHAAGVQDNLNLVEKDIEQFNRILSPKVNGTILLDELLMNEPLDFICYFSSSSAILGDFGSCDYAVGNRFLMAYASYRNSLQQQGLRNGRALALNWPLWRDGGMGFVNNELESMYLKASGQRYLEKEEGLNLLDQVGSHLGDHQLVLVGERNRVELFLGLSANSRMKMDYDHAKYDRTDYDMTLEQKVRKTLQEQIGKVLHIALEKIEGDVNLVDFGFDSISFAEFAARLNEIYGLQLIPSIFFKYPTLNKLIGYLLSKHNQQLQESHGLEEKTKVPPTRSALSVHQIPYLLNETAVSVTESSLIIEPQQSEVHLPIHEPIAIIGMSGRFPGADNVEQFWELISTGKTAIREMPRARRNDMIHLEDISDSIQKNQRNTWGGFLSEIDKFDPLFFGISPREAELMDPQQRLFLEEAWHALEDAGYMGERIIGTSCGVYVGVEESQYREITGDRGEISANQNATLAARIAYKLDLKGPNFAITAACSSGLVAVHQACQALRSGDCNLALAGGISLAISNSMFEGLDNASMLSSDGVCAVFDQRANGMVPGEAVAVLMLKPLTQAIQDKDRIYGCIQASGVNYDGHTNGMTAPSSTSQEELLKSIYSKYAIQPESIDYLMTHSVGAKIGDSIEIEALANLFKESSSNSGSPDEEEQCALGSVKPLIGHTFAASGIVSMITLLLAMRHKQILPLPQFQMESEYINLKTTPLYISKSVKPWSSAKGPLRGAVSTTGISGTNAHVVIDHYDMPLDAATEFFNSQNTQVILLSAKTKERLLAVIDQQLEYLNSNRSSSASLRDIAYTLAVGRESMKCRIAFVVESKEQWVRDLIHFKKTHALDNLNVIEQDIAQDEMQELVKNALETLQADVLATLWSKGAFVPWEIWYQNQPGARIISLPTYPFKKRRCWVDAKPSIEESREKTKGEHSVPPPATINKVDELYSFNAMERTLEFQEEYLTFAPFESKIEGFSMSSVLLHPEQYPEEAAWVRAKQIEMRQVLFWKEDLHLHQHILDIGCGHGTDVIQMASLYPHIHTHGYTISQAQAALGNERIHSMKLASRASIVHRDSALDPFPRKFDLIFGIEVCCHISEKHSLFQNIDRSLTEEGTILFMDFMANLRGPIVDHAIGIHIATVQQWIELLTTHHFKLEEIIDVSPEIANYLDDPECSRNTEHITPVARDSIRSYANNAISLRRGWIRYCLFKIRKNKMMSQRELSDYNHAKIAHPIPYAKAKQEMLQNATTLYPPASKN
ncbi:polyketide synthase PksM [Paenibacillus shirakamiensis]|uniref:Polyketide synthase PksM n=1 Tax=Paenibacillus shirakamiensis TaxID=1265935 RepID=A0ABS4JGU6_9BACL|nr:SDR family NAD(P)-dependent oxidoreductase [Paenibacillus shirakamiensis]MBP2000171.1 polyketide synthase PksM [Paenibacillus shirakamiensis]